MFDQLVVSGKIQKTYKPWSVALSAIVQGLILGVIILIPLIYTQALPKGMLNTFLVAPAPHLRRLRRWRGRSRLPR